MASAGHLLPRQATRNGLWDSTNNTIEVIGRSRDAERAQQAERDAAMEAERAAAESENRELALQAERKAARDARSDSPKD